MAAYNPADPRDVQFPLNAPGSLNFWIGGFGDYSGPGGEFGSGIMKYVMKWYVQHYGGKMTTRLENVLGMATGISSLNVYTGYQFREEILATIISYTHLYPNVHINIIGHSFGGADGMWIEDQLKAYGIEGNILITLDAVGLLPPKLPTNQKIWLNGFVDLGHFSLDNLAARIGGQYGRMQGADNTDTIVNATHQNALRIFDYTTRLKPKVLGEEQKTPVPPPVLNGGTGQNGTGDGGNTDEISNDISWPDFSEEEEEEGENLKLSDPETGDDHPDSTSAVDSQESSGTPDEGEDESYGDCGDDDYSEPEPGMDSVTFEGLLDGMEFAFNDPYDASNDSGYSA